VLRVLFTRADHLSLEEMRAADAQEDLRVEAQLRRAEAEDSQEHAEASA
jgi:hypothetical protein